MGITHLHAKQVLTPFDVVLGTRARLLCGEYMNNNNFFIKTEYGITLNNCCFFENRHLSDADKINECIKKMKKSYMPVNTLKKKIELIKKNTKGEIKTLKEKYWLNEYKVEEFKKLAVNLKPAIIKPYRSNRSSECRKIKKGSNSIKTNIEFRDSTSAFNKLI